MSNIFTQLLQIILRSIIPEKSKNILFLNAQNEDLTAVLYISFTIFSSQSFLSLNFHKTGEIKETKKAYMFITAKHVGTLTAPETTSFSLFEPDIANVQKHKTIV